MACDEQSSLVFCCLLFSMAKMARDAAAPASTNTIWRKLLYSGFEKCFAPSTKGAGTKTHLKSRFCTILKNTKGTMLNWKMTGRPLDVRLCPVFVPTLCRRRQRPARSSHPDRQDRPVLLCTRHTLHRQGKRATCTCTSAAIGWCARCSCTVHR